MLDELSARKFRAGCLELWALCNDTGRVKYTKALRDVIAHTNKLEFEIKELKRLSDEKEQSGV